jgi:hypothetical protein
VGFEIFQGIVIFVAVLFTPYFDYGWGVQMDGKRSMLLSVYSIVATSYRVYPDVDGEKDVSWEAPSARVR